MRCPNCGIEQPDGATECQGCQIFFEKWRKRQVSPQPAAPAPSQPGPVAGGGEASSGVMKGVMLSGLLVVAGPLAWKLVVKGAAERYVMIQLERNKTESPAQAVAAAEEILIFAIPGGAEGLVSSSASLLGIKANVAAVGNKKSGVMLLLMAISGLDEPGPDEALKSFKKEMAGKLKIEKTEVKSDRVAGESADITIDRGALPLDAKSNPTGRPVDLPMVSYLASVKCSKDTVMVWSMGLGESGEGNVSDVFKSLKCKGG